MTDPTGDPTGARPRPPHNAMVASAARIKLSERRFRHIRPQDWQREAWHFWDVIGEIQFATTYLANHLAKLRLYPAMVPNDPRDVPRPDDSEEGRAALSALRGVGGGYSEILREAALNLQVPGECFLVGLSHAITPEQADMARIPPSGAELPISEAQEWDIKSTDELDISTDGTYTLRDYPNAPRISLDDSNAFVTRIWLRHPRFSSLATSPIRGILSSAEEIERIERAIRAAAKSRAAGPGLLLLPDEMSFGSVDPTRHASAENADDDPFQAEMIEAMSTAVRDEGSAAALVPILVRGPAEMLKEVRKLSLSIDIDEKLLTLDRAITRLAQGLNIPPEIITGSAGLNHWPCSEDTEVLTRDGWVTHESLAPGVEVLTLDHSCGLSRWEPLAGVVRAEVTDHEMIEFKGQYHSSFTTPDHRWPVVMRDGRRLWTDTESLASGARRSEGPSIILGARSADIPTEPKFTDAFVEFLAWAITDADLTPRGRRCIRIRQRNPEHINEIRRVMTGIEHSERPDHSAGVVSFLLSADASEEVLPLGSISQNRWIVSCFTLDLFTAAQLELFLATCERANGGSNDGRTVFAVDPLRLLPIEYAAIRLGYRVTTRKRNHQHGFGETPVTRASWGSRTQLAIGPQHATTHAYTGTIFCPRVPIGRSFLARRDGNVFYTGNTAFLVSEEVFSAHVEPLAVPIVDALTIGYYRIFLEASGMSADEAARRMLWYDPTAVITRPNRSADADFGLDHNAISEKAWRKIKNISEEDAPTNVERLLRLILQRGSFDPVFTSVILRELGLTDETITQVINQPPSPQPQHAPAAEAPGTPEAERPSQTSPPRRAAASLTAAAVSDAALTDTDDADTDSVIAPATSTSATLSRNFVIVASSSPDGSEMGLRLYDIDHDISTRLHAASSAALTRAMDRATSVIISKFRDDPQFSAVIAGMHDRRREIPSRIGIVAMQTNDLTTDDLLRDAFAPLHAQFIIWATRAYARAIRVLGLSSDESPDDLAISQTVTEAADWLVSALSALAAARLFDPSPTPEPFGEIDDSSDVPFGIVREALARAGGAAPAGIYISTAGDPMGGIATGALLLNAFSRIGGGVEGWQWVYGETVRSREFPPHHDLDGVRFSSWTDDALSNRQTWPAVSHYVPGDHAGCYCAAAPVILPPQEAVA